MASRTFYGIEHDHDDRDASAVGHESFAKRLREPEQETQWVIMGEEEQEEEGNLGETTKLLGDSGGITSILRLRGVVRRRIAPKRAKKNYDDVSDEYGGCLVPGTWNLVRYGADPLSILFPAHAAPIRDWLASKACPAHARPPTTCN